VAVTGIAAPRGETMTNDRTTRSGLRTAGLAAAGVLAAVLTAAGVAAAATSNPTHTPSAPASAGASGSGSTQPGGTPIAPAPRGDRDGFDPGGADPVRPDEESVSSDVAERLSAAALKAVPGATVIRVETDAGDGEYEVHLRTSDGSLATVKLDGDYAVIGVQDGMGLGDPAPASGPGGPDGPDGDVDATSGSGPTSGTASSASAST
jgi:hypothetical protein